MNAFNWSLKFVIAKIAKYLIGFVNPNSMLSNQFLNYAKVAKYLIGLVNPNSMLSNQFLNYFHTN